MKVSSTWLTLAWPVAPSRGKDTLVPPSKSMPKVNPLSTMLAMATRRITPVTVNHSLRRPTTSKPPVPVNSLLKKPCLGAVASAVVVSSAMSSVSVTV